MRQAQWKKTVAPLFPVGSGWTMDGNFAYQTDYKFVVRGVLREDSIGDASYVWRVRLPLFIPLDTLVLTYSSRVGGIFPNGEILELLSAVKEARGRGTEEELLLELTEFATSGNKRSREMAGYALLLLGQIDEALKIIETVSNLIPQQPREAEPIDRATLIASMVVGTSPVRAIEQLEKWAAQSAIALELRRV